MNASSRRITFLLGTLVQGCWGVPGTDPAVYVKRLARNEAAATASQWMKERSIPADLNTADLLDRVVFCAFGGCIDYARRLVPITEERLRDQYTISIAQEVGAAVVSENLRQYRATAAEYGALRTIGLLLQPSIAAVRVEAMRITLDLQKAVSDGDSSLMAALRGPALIASVALEGHEPEISRRLLALAGTETDGTHREYGGPAADVIVLLVDVVAPLEENVEAFTWQDGSSIRMLRVATPQLPSATDAPRSCTIASGQVTSPAMLVTDFHHLYKSETDKRIRAAVARSLARAIGKAVLANEIGKSTNKGSGAEDVAARSMINIALAATETADLRSPRLLPRLVYLARIERNPQHAIKASCPPPLHARQFPEVKGQGVPIGIYSVRTLWGTTSSGRIAN